MVKLLVLFVIIVSVSFADSVLHDKIKGFIGEERYQKNRSFIEIIFKDAPSFYHNEHLNVVEVIETLKANGLLKLYFKEPKHLELRFHTNGTPLFFVTLMGDALRSIGYYRYLTQYSKSDSSGFVWQIGLTSEYMTDPTVLRRELLKRGCDITDIERQSDTLWDYTIDMAQAHLDVDRIAPEEQLFLKRSLTPHWVNISSVNKLKLTSLGSNSWYPYIAFFDAKLHLLKVYKRDKKTWQIKINMPDDAIYAKIGDLYNLKNIKDGLEAEALGEK
ncbi:MAG: hypothetical protein U9N52_08565 [Campylobacterota bacterium]|nr:hypothetical protein [Campylobacterota bacterium]